MPTALYPEFSLAAACAAWPASDRRTETIHVAATKQIDWPQFLRVVNRHGVCGLVREGLKHGPQIPLEILGEIEQQAKTLLCSSLAMAVETDRLQRLFDE